MPFPVGGRPDRSPGRTRPRSIRAFATVVMSVVAALLVVVVIYVPRTQTVPAAASARPSQQLQDSRHVSEASAPANQSSDGQLPDTVDGKPVLRPSQLSQSDLSEPGKSLLLGGYLVFDVPSCITSNDKRPAQCSGLSLWSEPVPDNYVDDAPVPLFPSDVLTSALPRPDTSQWPTPIVLQAHVPDDESCSMATDYDCSTGIEPDRIVWQGEPASVPPMGYTDPVTLRAGPLDLSSGPGWTATQQSDGSWSIAATGIEESTAQTTFVMSKPGDVDVSSALAISDHYPNAHGVQYGPAQSPAWIAQIGTGQTRESVLGAEVDGVVYEFDLSWVQAGANLPLYLSELNTISKPLMGLDDEQK